MPSFLTLDKAKIQFSVRELAAQFIPETIPSNRALDQTFVSLLVNLNEFRLSQLLQNNLAGISELEVCINKFRAHGRQFRGFPIPRIGEDQEKSDLQTK